MNIPEEEGKHIKNCFFYKDKYFFFFCEKYCEKFHVTKYSPVFDGRLEEYKTFVNHVSTFRKEQFYLPTNNFLLDDTNGIERFLLDSYQTVLQNEILIKASGN